MDVAVSTRSSVRDIAIIAPTFNERDNVLELVRRLEAVLAGKSWEIVFVDDDSTDGTHDVLMKAARTDSRVRLIRRVGRRGLSTAVIEGILSTSAPIVGVIDADLQHDETVLPEMISKLERDGCELVVGSRYVEGGGVGDWSRGRLSMSRFATALAKYVTKAELTDPMSGYFAMRREAFERSVRDLSGEGYKILLDVLASAREPLRTAEVPYTLRNRLHGESKLDSAVLWEYAMLLIDKTVGHIVPARFLMFVFVGGLGLFAHFAVLALTFRALGVQFVAAQTAATIGAMTFNFFLNNSLTYRDRRLRGAWGLVRGLLTFYAICAVGAVANIGVASFFFDQSYSWWLSGVAGVLVGAVWNYAATSIFTWKK